MLWGALLIVVGGFAWLGQLISAVNPRLAARFDLAETESEVDPAFYADARGEAIWDSLSLWTLPVAGFLLILDSSAWPYFGLIGGAIFIYFAGRGIVARMSMRRKGISIGRQSTVSQALVALSVWGLLGVVTLVAAAVTDPF